MRKLRFTIKNGRVILPTPRKVREKRRKLDDEPTRHVDAGDTIPRRRQRTPRIPDMRDPVWEVAVQERHVRIYYVRARNSTEARQKVFSDDPLAQEGPSEFVETLSSDQWEVYRVAGGIDQFEEWEREQMARVRDRNRIDE